MNDKPVINLGTTIGAGDSKSVSHTFDKAGYITQIHARAYPGEDRSVERRIRLWRGGKDEGNPIPVIRQGDGSDAYLSGQDETWQFDMRREFREKDEIEVSYKNTGEYAYPVQMLVTVEHERSLIEKIGGLL